MITKDEIKKEVDKLPDNLLEEVYSLLKRVIETPRPLRDETWIKWNSNLEKFTSDFMETREQSGHQSRESFD